jgi:fibronectin type 3 domain-containing protein
MKGRINQSGVANRRELSQIQRDLRNACKFEALEGRSMLSASILAAPSALTATATAPTDVALHWTDNAPAATGYYVLRSTDNVHFSQIANISGGSTRNYADSATTSGTKYYYQVKAFDAATTSAASAAASATTPLVTPTGLTAGLSGSSINLAWTDNDASATGYYVLRSTDDVHFSQFAKISSSSTENYTDSATASGTKYYYEIEAFDAVTTSGASAAANATTPLVTPTGLTASVSGSSIKLTWTDNDASATGYYVLRSTDDVHFSQIAKISKGSTKNYTDSTTASGTKYYYQVEAFDAVTTSAASAAASAITPLVTPTGLTAKLSGLSVELAWTDKDASATGYCVFRSTDGLNWSQIAIIAGNSTRSYTDSTTTWGTKYYYEIVSFDAVTTSAMSAAASVTTPSSGVTVTTRYGDELVVTAAGADDSVSIFESGSTFTIDADGKSYTDAATAAGLFVYTRGGKDTIDVDKSVTSETTLETIDGALTTITSAGSDVIAWIDSTDIYSGTGTVHAVASFAGGVSKAIGAALANPKDAGKTVTVNASLFGTCPVAGDVNQGEVGDCYFLSSLAAFAGQNPNVLVQSAVDMGDGTYTVQFISNGKPTYVRVSNQFSAGPFEGLMYAHPGTDGSIWAMVFEKAFAYFRTGANTYASTNSGWMGEVYADFGVSSTAFYPSNYTATTLFDLLSSDLADGQEVTLGTYSSPPNLVGCHAYTLVSAYMDSNGVTHYVVRNPWGVSGDSLENSQGYATLTYAQLVANFGDGCVSV